MKKFKPCYAKLKGYPFVVWVYMRLEDGRFSVMHPSQKRRSRSKTFTNWHEGKLMSGCETTKENLIFFKKCPRKFKKLLH